MPDMSLLIMTGLVVFILTELTKRELPVNTSARITNLTTLLWSVGAVFAMAASSWGDTQVFLKITLSNMNTIDKLIASLFVFAVAVGWDIGRNVIMNIGQNQP